MQRESPLFFNCKNRRVEEEIRCYSCEKMGHYAKKCKEKNQSVYNTKNNNRHLNYIGIHYNEGSRILDNKSSSDEDNEKRFYSISTRSHKYENARTNTRKNKTDNFSNKR